MELLEAMEPWMIPIVVMICVTAIVLITTVGGIIKAAIKRKSGNLSENKEFLAALREFKEKTDRRLANLEAIVTGDESVPGTSTKEEMEKTGSKNAIEIEIEESQNEQKKSKESGKLRNMLNQ